MVEKLSYIQQGIKAVGVGRRGSKSMAIDLINNIIQEFKQGDNLSVIEGAFLGALMIKGLSKEEEALAEAFDTDILHDPQVMVEYLARDVDQVIKNYCYALLTSKKLSKADARAIGDYILSHKSNTAVCGLVASILRVRYETQDEYEGLLDALEQTYVTNFSDTPLDGQPIVQIADPFNGTNKTNLVTPLLAEYVQSLGYRVVTLCGRSGGPKFGNNVQDLARGLGANFLSKSQNLDDSKPTYGWYLDQASLSAAMDRWVDLRRETIKRPFMATLERLINPLQADILIASAFHPPYGEKVLDLAEYMNFKKVIIIRNGLEGTTSFALKRPTKVLVSTKDNNGSYKREEIEFDAENELNITVPVEEKIVPIVMDKNIDLIKTYIKNGSTGYDLFDWRIAAMKKCMGKILA